MDIQFERSYPTPLSNSTLLPILLLSLARQKHTPHVSTWIDKEYDYIVVGGGAAGSVVAGRLSEEPRVSVLLLEAGHQPPLLTELPAVAVYFPDTDVDWKYKTVPQKYAAYGLDNEQVKWPMGKMLGGSGNHNGMMYVRGNRKNYDDWAAQGAKGWSYQDVFPYFLKMEDNTTPDQLANGYHAKGGPITVEQTRYYSEMKQALTEAATALGYRFVDPNAGRQTGFYDPQRNARDNQRCSSVKGYLVPAENRTNLNILLNAMATKIITEGGRATGVQFFHEGQFKVVKASREVILSAGAVNSPQILMLSGIGPREELLKWNIPVIADLPVGKNLQDHAKSVYVVTLDPRIEAFGDQIKNSTNILQYIANRSGPLTETGTLMAFLNGQNVRPAIDFPNHFLFMSPIPNKPLSGLGLKPEVYRKYADPYEGMSSFWCQAFHSQPKSRGTITLNSTNPFDPPLIDPNYLEHPSDLQDIVDALKTCQKLFRSDPVRKLGVRPYETLVPGCEMHQGSEDDYFKCYARTLLFTGSHPVGTCKMGDPKDPTTVVDPELRVKNVKGLRVADASIMPTVPSGNTHVPTLMIAEKASDMIKESMLKSWRKPAFLENKDMDKVGGSWNLQTERSYPTPLSNSTLLPLLLHSLARQRHTPRVSTRIDNEYDYIVVGGGTAGSVVAGRLSEEPRINVLLVEAGHEPPLLTELPVLDRYFQGADTDLDWKFKTVPQKHASYGLDNRQMKWPLAKMLGGASNHNSMLYVRGNRKNYDDWAANGAKGWSYQDVFPYFLKMENNTTPDQLANGYHGTGGPITVEQTRYRSEMTQALSEGAATLGYRFVDLNGRTQTGFYDPQRNTRDNQRCSTVKGYLVPSENNKNLNILLNAMVTKIIIEGGRATGVQFYHEGQFKVVKARKEVILSAGVVNSPKILMLSGIGPREELLKWNIPVVADLPVGKNLHDHAKSVYPVTLDPSAGESREDQIRNSTHILQYIESRSGPLTQTVTLAAFLNGQTPGDDFPDYALYMSLSSKTGLKDASLNPEVYRKFAGPYEGMPSFTCEAQHLQPKSRGTLTLSSADPFDPPLIDPNYLEHPSDLQDIVDGLKMCKRLFNTYPVRKLGVRPFETLVPGCEVYQGSEDDYFKCYARTLLFTNYHPVGTCKMGDPRDPTTVVDPELRVKNIKGLRVVDAAIMPMVPSANTHVPTLMVAEKASDMIKESMFNSWRIPEVTNYR